MLSTLVNQNNYCYEPAIWQNEKNKGRVKCTDYLKKDELNK